MADGKFKMAVTAEYDLAFPMGKCIHDLLRKTSKTNRVCRGCDLLFSLHLISGLATLTEKKIDHFKLYT
jgi:hypothetical protein